MAFKKIKTINREEIDESGNVTIVPIGPLYYDKDTGDYEVRSQKSNFKTYNDSKSETVIFKNGVFQPGQTGKFGINEVNVIDDVLSTIYNIKKKIGAEAVANLPADYEQTKADTFIVEQEWKASQTNDSPGGEFKSKVKSSSSDTILKSFKMMKYPIDADYGNTQDYIVITQYTYSPVRGDLFSGEGGVFKNLTNGVARDNPKKDLINMVKLPIPNTLSDSNGVSWGEDRMNALAAAAAGAVSQVVNKDNIQGLMTNPLQTIGREAGETFNQVKDGLGGIGKAFQEVAKNDSMTNLAAATLGSTVLNRMGVNMSAESILARGQGVVPNKNLELLFRGPTLRTFSFTWRMSPRSKEEALMVNKIIRSFKQGMAAKKIRPDSATGASFLLGTPNIFDIHFETRGGEFIDGLFRVKTSACTTTSVNYTDGAQWSAYDDGQPTSINLTLGFEELEPIYSTDYSEDPLGAEGSLEPVPDTSIGY